MSERERQTMSLNRQSILAVTGVGVGLLTLVYVLGVQVGKRSAALRGEQPGKAGEELDKLPGSLKDQLKELEQGRPPLVATPAPPAPDGTAPADGTQAAADPKADPKATDKPKEPADEAVFTLQVLATPDAAEARRVAANMKLMRLDCVVLKDKNLHKVRLTKLSTRAGLQKTINRLTGAGYKPFIIKME